MKVLSRRGGVSSEIENNININRANVAGAAPAATLSPRSGAVKGQHDGQTLKLLAEAEEKRRSGTEKFRNGEIDESIAFFDAALSLLQGASRVHDPSRHAQSRQSGYVYAGLPDGASTVEPEPGVGKRKTTLAPWRMPRDVRRAPSGQKRTTALGRRSSGSLPPTKGGPM